MMRKVLSIDLLDGFIYSLRMEEKSEATVEKYTRDVRAFHHFSGETEINKELVMEYKKHLIEQGYAVRSVNSMLASVNKLFSWLGWQNCRVKNIRTQREIYCSEEKELTKAEYLRLLKASEPNRQLNLILQTICATGIRVSELKYFTVDAVKRGEVRVSCKNKTRTILVPGKLKKMLLNFARQKGIRTGNLFVNRKGKPLDRSVIWAAMKKLCCKAKVAQSKVFPHNLRKLFARTFYAMEKDIAKLADILGHSSIETTRIYIMSTGVEHRRRIELLGLLI